MKEEGVIETHTHRQEKKTGLLPHSREIQSLQEL